MFNKYNIKNIVKNKDILKSFHVEVVDIENSKALRLEKKQSAVPIIFYVNLDRSYPIFFTLLNQTYFPSSITIVSKVGKKVCEYMTEHSQKRNIRLTNKYFIDSSLETIIFRYFKYKNIKFDGLKNLVRLNKLHVYTKSEEVRSHILIRYFIDRVQNGIYEEDVFKVIVHIFDSIEDTRDSLKNILSCMEYTEGTLKFQSLFVVRENNTLEAVNYGRALAAAVQGNPISSCNLDWSDYFSRRSVSSPTSEVVEIGSKYENFFSEQVERFEQSRTGVLTSEVTESYNRTIPNLVYWNIQ